YLLSALFGAADAMPSYGRLCAGVPYAADVAPLASRDNKKGSSRITGEGGLDLHEEVIAVAVTVGHALDDLDLVVDAFELSGMHRPAHPADDAAPVAAEAAGKLDQWGGRLCCAWAIHCFQARRQS